MFFSLSPFAPDNLVSCDGFGRPVPWVMPFELQSSPASDARHPETDTPEPPENLDPIDVVKFVLTVADLYLTSVAYNITITLLHYCIITSYTNTLLHYFIITPYTITLLHYLIITPYTNTLLLGTLYTT